MKSENFNLSPLVVVVLSALLSLAFCGYYNEGYTCEQTCGTSLRDRWNGQQVCYYIPGQTYEIINSPWSQCYVECMEYEVAVNQRNCFWNMCQMTDYVTYSSTNETIIFLEYFNTFCEKPGLNKLTSKSDCDEILNGNVHYFGDYCFREDWLESGKLNYGDPSLNESTCWTQCGGKEEYYKGQWEGTLVCAGENLKTFINTKCYFNCIGKDVAEDQQSCMFHNCRYGLNAYYNFCDKPGPNNSLKSEEECETRVGTGEAIFHGRYCAIIDEDDFWQYSAPYATPTNNEDFLKCQEKCGGVEQYSKEMLEKAFVCGYRKDKVNPKMSSRCIARCLGYHIPTDQKSCAISACKNDLDDKVEVLAHSFCRKPGENGSLNTVECDYEIREEHAWYYGTHC